MIWQDILVETPVGDAELVAALATLMQVRADDVEILSDIADISPRRVSCCRYDRGGDFPLMLSICCDDLTPPDEVEGAIRLSQLLSRRVLIDGGTVNPHVMRLVDCEKVVKVDVEVVEGEHGETVRVVKHP